MRVSSQEFFFEASALLSEHLCEASAKKRSIPADARLIGIAEAAAAELRAAGRPVSSKAVHAHVMKKLEAAHEQSDKNGFVDKRDRAAMGAALPGADTFVEQVYKLAYSSVKNGGAIGFLIKPDAAYSFWFTAGDRERARAHALEFLLQF